MAASKNPALRLHHILDEAEAIQRATQGVTFEVWRVEKSHPSAQATKTGIGWGQAELARKAFGKGPAEVEDVE
jgi:hypothetical protein